MIKVGITGGIGSGKSLICDIVRGEGFPVFNCDIEAKNLMIEDEIVVEDISQVVGQNAYYFKNDKDGVKVRCINKTAVANFLFQNDNNAQIINSIVHPRLEMKFNKWADGWYGVADMIFMEAAILFESGFDRFVDEVILVCANRETRINRVVKRDKTTRELVVKRMMRQERQDDLIKRVKHIIYNDTELNHDNYLLDLRKQLLNQLDDIRSLYNI